MTTKIVPGQLIAASDSAEVAREAASRIALSLRTSLGKNGKATLALSGGNTPRDAYALLAREPGIDWTKVDVFWVDERAVPSTDDRSNYRWAKATLIDVARIPPVRVHRMPADAPLLDAAAAEYERAIRDGVQRDEVSAVPAFQVLVLGVGEDGHTASLFPGEPTVEIADKLVAPVPASGTREARLTLTSPVIEHARHVFVLAVGAGKRQALERVWEAQGDVRQTPARVIRSCLGAVTWIIDRAAGGVAS
jgi:6-phosphogluconolactonase